MSKIIVNTGTLSAGGAERVLSILSKPLADAFDEVHYVMWLDAKYPDIFYDIDPRVKIVRLSKESGATNILQQMIWFRRYIKREHPDVVLSFMVMVCFTVTIALLLTGINQVVAERNDPNFFRPKWLRRLINWSYLSSDVKGIIMQTEKNKIFFSNGRLLRKTTVIYNPIDIDDTYVGAAVKHKKEDVIVSVGRLTNQKQQWVLIEAFALFHKTHPSYKLVIYGEGEKRKDLEEQVVLLKMKESVILPGRSKQVIRDILPAKMFVTTSLYEGMSNALIEAMCVGLPCISTSVSGATDLINDGKNGFLVDEGDVKKVFEKMLFIADHSEEANTLGCNASQAYHLLSSEVISGEWVNYLKSMI